jgi:ribonuclease P protein component
MPGIAPTRGTRNAGGKPDERLGRQRRLTHSKEFREAYDQGRRWDGRCMTLWLRAGPGASLRLGVVSSRKVGGAVQRNRARRLLREAYRRNRCRFQGDADVVLIARRAILAATWPEIVEDLLSVAGRAGLMKEEQSKLGT